MPSIAHMSVPQYLLYKEIQDIIGPANLWPHRVHNWFLYGVPKGVGKAHRLRPLMAVFFYVNGLNPVVFDEWCAFDKDSHPLVDRSHYRWLFRSFERGFMSYAYSWNISQGHYQYIDGTICNRHALRPKSC